MKSRKRTESPSSTMAERKLRLYIAIYPNPPGFNNWALFIDIRDNPILLEAKGSEGRFHFEE